MARTDTWTSQVGRSDDGSLGTLDIHSDRFIVNDWDFRLQVYILCSSVSLP